LSKEPTVDEKAFLKILVRELNDDKKKWILIIIILVLKDFILFLMLSFPKNIIYAKGCMIILLLWIKYYIIILIFI